MSFKSLKLHEADHSAFYKLGWEVELANAEKQIQLVVWEWLRSFPSCRCRVAALLTLKANIWLDTLTVKQWEIMINNDVLLFFLRPMRKQLMSSSYFTAPVALWLTTPPTLPNHISYISKSNNALILLFLLNVMIIITTIFLSNPKPFSKFFWYPELLFLVFIQPLY